LAFIATLIAASPAFATTVQLGNRILQPGMSGPDVAILQEDLTIAGFQTLSTGVYNAATASSVAQFQSSNHLESDGVAGPATVKLIKRIVHRAVERAAAAAAKTGAVSATQTTPLPTTTTPSTATTPTSGTTPTGTTSTTATTPTATTPTTTTPTVSTGGFATVPPASNAPFARAALSSTGLAVAPITAPMAIQNAIDAGNQIAFLPYIYGGGHASFVSAGYDCSGSVSYVLHAMGILNAPLDSSQFETWGLPGPGRWITLWANGGHVYMKIAGLWYDTAAQTSANGNDRWSTTRISPGAGFIEIHPAGW
jgi:peptidoglycan hydrolase-like protein with peptidoglycan-binding domain